MPSLRSLVRVRERGMKIALATSSNQEDLATYGKIIGMEDLVDEASSSADAKASKPDADIFAAALEKSGMRPDQAWQRQQLERPAEIEIVGRYVLGDRRTLGVLAVAELDIGPEPPRPLADLEPGLGWACAAHGVSCKGVIPLMFLDGRSAGSGTAAAHCRRRP